MGVKGGLFTILTDCGFETRDRRTKDRHCNGWGLKHINWKQRT